MGRLEQRTSIPLYEQVMNGIRDKIESGAYQPGSQIPTEHELAEAYCVGRVTVRRAIEELAAEGYLTKQQGRGTFVNPPKLLRKVQFGTDVQSFSAACREDGMEAGSTLVARLTAPAGRELAAFLGIPEGDDVLVIERLRTADGIPVLLDRHYLPRERFAFLLGERLDGPVSLFELLHRRAGIRPRQAPGRTIEIVRANREVAAALGVPEGEPLFLMKSRFFDTDGAPLFVGWQYIVGSRFVLCA